MTDPTLAVVERRLERATELESEPARVVLQTAREDLETLADDPTIDETRRQTLERRVTQRLREVDDRSSYSGELGASMNPDDEDAP